MSEESHIKLTKDAMSQAYVPYSNYPVGVLIITDKGWEMIFFEFRF